LKKTITSFLKFALAVGLIYWLVATEKITAEPFLRLWDKPWLIPFMFATVFCLIFINNYRWLLLLQGQQIASSVKQTLSLTFIGLFFNLAMPGSVGGDVIKAFYIVKEQPGTRLRAATSVLMDRVVGLYAMGLVALTSVIINYEKIGSIPQLRILALFIIALVGAFTVFFMIGFSRRVRNHSLMHKILDKTPGGKLIERIYDAVHGFRNGKTQFALGILLSIGVQGLNITSLYILARALGFETASLSGFFFIIPLGLIATAIPISPAGIGVGQAVFLALFTWYDGSTTQVGPALITISQVVQAAWAIVGAILYFLRKAPIDVKVPAEAGGK